MKIPPDTLEDWRNRCALFLEGYTCQLSDVKTGVNAWTVAHKTGIVQDAYKIPGVVDAHIQTALEHIFPDAVFKDKKAY